MATKTTKTKKAASKKKVTKTTGEMKITEVEALKLSKSQLQLQLLEAQRVILAKEKAEYIASIDPNKQIQAFDQAVSENVSVANGILAEYKAIIQTINDKFGIDMSEYGYDDVTGVLTKI